MTEHNTFPGSVYTVTCKDGCAVTDASGELNMYCEAGGQLHVTAPSDKLYTSADASVRKVNFKHALAALGLLGGGVSELPAGYIAAEFLESTGTQYINTGLVKSGEYKARFEYAAPPSLISGQMFGWNYLHNNVRYRQMFAFYNTLYFGRFVHYSTDDYILPLKFNETGYDGTARNVLETTEMANVVILNGQKVSLSSLGSSSNADNPLNASITLLNVAYGVKTFAFAIFDESGKAELDYIPALATSGKPCMYDRVSKQPVFNAGTGEFVVGFTLEQARKLRILPAGGGELTISLPSNWQDDAAVVDALLTAEGKGWVLTIQTYEAEAGAVSTFALRRIWVRKRAEQNGSYVAKDGTRWQIDWCATMVGGDPQDHGYEPFRSVEAAAAYWEMEPYVAPETEQLLTD